MLFLKASCSYTLALNNELFSVLYSRFSFWKVICRVFSTLSRRISLYLSIIWTRRATPGISSTIDSSILWRFSLLPLTISDKIGRHLQGWVLFMVAHTCSANQNARYFFGGLSVSEIKILLYYHLVIYEPLQSHIFDLVMPGYKDVQYDLLG